MTGDHFDDYQDPDDCELEVWLLLLALIALILWLFVAACAESAQVVIP